MASANGRWSMSSGLRQSSSGGLRTSILNSSVMMSQRPSPMAPLTVDEYGALSSSVMGPPMSVGNRYDSDGENTLFFLSKDRSSRIS